MNNFLKKVFNSDGGSNKSRIPFRLNFIFIIVGILFAVLVAHLAVLQIINGNKYKAEVNRSDNATKLGNVQRGMIYDSAGRVLVGNKSHQAIQYTKALNVTSSELYNIANNLSKYISLDDIALTPGQKAEYYLANPVNLKAVSSKLTFAKNATPDDQYQKELEYVKNDKDIKFNKREKNAAAIFQKMSGAYQLSTTYIKSTGVTSRELAEVGEHLSEMPGVQVGDSWTRDYPNGSSIQSIIGTVSSEKAGLPSDKINSLLAQGYSRNDSVGQSYLEAKYEPVLRGSKSQTQVKISSENSSMSNMIKKYGGQKGDNLQLTINSQFQKKLQELVANADRGTGYSTGAYAVVMNPNTGAVIGLAGVDRNPSTGKETPNALGTINSGIVMGSVVKGATVSGALMDKVITPTNSVLVDKPIFGKSSWFNHGGSNDVAVDASTALEISSNSYMMQLAMKEGGYKPGGPLTSMSPSVFGTLRGYFNQFGLGVKTGIDLPGETTGFKGPSGINNLGKALDMSFGNYDSYTMMQVAQYMSTIANGGYRIQPHIVQNIRGTNKDGKMGPVKYSVTPNVLNKIDIKPSELAVVKKGLYNVVHGTNQFRTGMQLNEIKPEISAKTGTAQSFYNGKETVNLTLASYAPSDNPQVVVAVAIPNLPVDSESNNIVLAKQIYQAYWKYVQSSEDFK
ncbi:peptidoglycan D,D-transpeptidase FtsI family protein [Apilactobacillus xinyiensis]|uniref:peptidoglycan D,D-transpeptidase FtsI family protein n=1 Tax=Apilactobacillus xinyiensis TaxID=2841032 RepID=UPI00200FA55B|nr:penicillin-binding protein 2 [Apilactobacillus xinyiensis]MCL0329478.1 penicillin-binding protein 2 [Apilactobacillus xinyiensis]